MAKKGDEPAASFDTEEVIKTLQEKARGVIFLS